MTNVRKAKIELTFTELQHIQDCLKLDTDRIEKLANQVTDETAKALWEEAQKTRIFRGALARRFFEAEDEQWLQARDESTK